MVIGMLAIFIGIPFLIVTMLDDSISKKRDIKRSQDNMSQWQLNQSNWERKVVDVQLEDELIEMLTFQYEAFIEKYWNEIESTAEEIWGDYYKQDTSMLTGDNIIRVLMANRGKLTRSDAGSGIHANEDSWKNGNDQRRDIRYTTKLVFWIDKKLKEHGVNEQLLSQGGLDHYIVRGDHEFFWYTWKPIIMPIEWSRIKEYTPPNPYK